MPKNLEIFAAFYTRRLNIVYHVCLAKTERKFNLRGRTNEKLGETNDIIRTQITLYGFSFRFVIPYVPCTENAREVVNCVAGSSSTPQPALPEQHRRHSQHTNDSTRPADRPWDRRALWIAPRPLGRAAPLASPRRAHSG